MIKQLPCPYCKDSWLFVSKYDYGSDYENKGYQGTCKCGRFNKIVTWNKTKEQAIEEWNRIVKVCWDCEHFGEKAVTGRCIKCRDKDMWEMKKGGAK